ncbi:uncharacterized protein LOC143345813 [Colletes latitarsis]|uniref:uncharacterized protein LOC143345813 n=1 Tax=Colletes latitarsis TaxID=2605962 RepID=UPI0040354B48
MGEVREREEKVETECNVETENENKSTTDVDPPEIANLKIEENKCQLSNAVTDHSCPSKAKETVTGTKVKRKSRSTRRKLNALVSNASLHFSDTDSEGELTTIKPQTRSSQSLDIQQAPTISVTSDNVEFTNGLNENTILSPDKEMLQCNNFLESLTDVDEIYPSETENDQKENETSLKVTENSWPDETDLEDIEGGEEVQTMIYVKPRSDVFCEYGGETIITKESDGPFSVEIRNKMYVEEVRQSDSCSNAPDIVVMSNTDEEDMAISDEEDAQEVCCSQKEILEDLDVLVASQIVMRHINKPENMLIVRDTSDDAISDCHTDTEEVDQNE